MILLPIVRKKHSCTVNHSKSMPSVSWFVMTQFLPPSLLSSLARLPLHPLLQLRRSPEFTDEVPFWVSGYGLGVYRNLLGLERSRWWKAGPTVRQSGGAVGRLGQVEARVTTTIAAVGAVNGADLWRDPGDTEEEKEAVEKKIKRRCDLLLNYDPSHR